MWSRRGIGRTEVIIGVVVVLVIAVVATPFFMGPSNKALRDEVPLYVEQIKAAQLASYRAFDTYQACEAAPRPATEVGPDSVPWTPTRGFIRLAWEPENVDAVYGSYRVVLTDEGFTVIGTSDIDGDGRRAIFEATQDSEVTMTSDPETY